MKERAMRINTRCGSVDELVALFHPFCDETSVFISTGELFAVGTEAPFAILLADHRIAIQGWCIVFDAWSDANNPFRRPGVRLGLHRMTPESMQVVERMQAARGLVTPATPNRVVSATLPPRVTLPAVRRPPRKPTITIQIPVRAAAPPRAAHLDLFEIEESEPTQMWNGRPPTPLPVLAEGSGETQALTGEVLSGSDDVAHVIDVPAREVVAATILSSPTPAREWWIDALVLIAVAWFVIAAGS